MKRVGRTRGISMSYMENRSFQIERWPAVLDKAGARDPAQKTADLTSGAGSRGSGGVPSSLSSSVHVDQPRTMRVDASDVCSALRERANGGRWSYPNSGVRLKQEDSSPDVS